MFPLHASILNVSNSNFYFPMKPLINLKSFLAVLLILIVPVALLVAYFRNYSPEAGGHEHSEMAKRDGAAIGKDGDMSAMKPSGDSNAATGHGNMAMPQGGQPQAETSQPPAAQSQKEGDHAAMGHGNMGQPSPAQSQPPRGQGPQQTDAVSAQEQLSIAVPGARPGIPGASHLYHVGATGFFLDHPQHITLSTEQRKKLNQVKEQARLNKASADRKVQEAEQQLWKLTAVEEPDTAQIETKVREIEKLHVAQRLAFIRSVGEAAKVLTEEQTNILLGTAAPVTPDAKPATPESKPAVESAAKPAHSHKP
jgi:Spy/CpxP family protein refolding chaperone